MPADPPSTGPPERPPANDAVRTALYLDAVRTEWRALGVCAAAAAFAIVWIARPVGVGILLGAFLAFSLQPFFERVAAWSRRPRLTALGCVVVSTVGLAGVVVGLSSLFIARGAVLASALMALLAPGGAARDLVERLSAQAGPFRIEPEEISARLHAAAAELAARAAGIAATVASTTFGVLLALFFAMMTLSFILLRWTAIAVAAERVLPLPPHYTRALLVELRRIGRATLLGTVITGLAQGVLAALGFWFTGVPEPAFFGAATAVASLVPVVGTLIVWVPVGIVLLVTGHVARGVLALCWGGLVVVGVSDYVIRPRLVEGGSEMPSLLTFTALFGGLELFGLVGLLIGPVIVSLSYAILRIYAREAEERRASLGRLRG